MTNTEILNHARVLIVGIQTGAHVPTPDGATRYDEFCIEVAAFVLRGEDYRFHCKSSAMLRAVRAFAAKNGWRVTVVEDYGDGRGAVSIGRVRELQQ